MQTPKVSFPWYREEQKREENVSGWEMEDNQHRENVGTKASLNLQVAEQISPKLITSLVSLPLSILGKKGSESGILFG